MCSFNRRLSTSDFNSSLVRCFGHDGRVVRNEKVHVAETGESLGRFVLKTAEGSLSSVSFDCALSFNPALLVFSTAVRFFDFIQFQYSVRDPVTESSE